MDKPKSFTFSYDESDTIEQKITKIAQNIYGAKGVQFGADALRDIKRLYKFGFDKLPICMAKTQYSLSDNPKLLGCPSDFDITVRELVVAHGAGFIVVICGDIMRMPGLPKSPSAQAIDVIDGQIVGLF